jgi:protein-L-isoaspartate(D-aspartate) O-methyltransferase
MVNKSVKYSESSLRGIGMTSQRTRDRLIARLREEGIRNEDVLKVMQTVPRHLFVDEALGHRAYEDSSLPIGHGQTISRPFTVARMTELLLSRGVPDKVLEVGTGSGYQAAILSRLIPRVYSVERISPLLTQARERFYKLGYSNIVLNHSDGSWGWKQHGPYLWIIVTAAPEEVPQALLDQLAPSGMMIIPVGSQTGKQKLLQITRDNDEFVTVELDPVKFVPLLNGAVGR